VLLKATVLLEMPKLEASPARQPKGSQENPQNFPMDLKLQSKYLKVIQSGLR
jgi:hypothetical protein